MSGGEQVCVVYWALEYFLWRNLFARFSIGLLVLFFCCTVLYSGSPGPSRQIICKHFMPFQECAASCSIDGALSCPKSLGFDVVQLPVFSFVTTFQFIGCWFIIYSFSLL